MSTCVFPVRSNARSLVTGSALSSVRSRLKTASVLYGSVLLEHGLAEIQAGPSGGSSLWMPNDQADEVRWQTPRERGEARRHAFTFLVGTEDTPGVAATEMVPFIQSDTTIRWSATLEPFRHELPAGCDWVDWVYSNDPTGEAGRRADDWCRHDGRNAALRNAIPEQFVRSRVIKNANRDLVLAIGSGFVVSQDRLHLSVVRNRFNDEDQLDWQLQGYALPILVPAVADYPWEGIVALRKEKGLQHLRGVLNEIEAETMETAVNGGDLEAAVHHALERQLAVVAAKVDSVGGTAKRTLVGLLVGTSSGVATMGLTGPLGILASSALGAIAGVALDARAVVRNRGVKQWIGVMNRLRATTT